MTTEKRNAKIPATNSTAATTTIVVFSQGARPWTPITSSDRFPFLVLLVASVGVRADLVEVLRV